MFRTPQINERLSALAVRKTIKEARQAAYIKNRGTMAEFDVACHNAMTAGIITYGEYLAALDNYKRDFEEIK